MNGKKNEKKINGKHFSLFLLFLDANRPKSLMEKAYSLAENKREGNFVFF